MERGTKGSKGEANEIRATPGCERARVQIDAGGIDTVGPKDVAKAFEIKGTTMSRRGFGHVAASGSSVENHGEKKIVG